MASKKRAARKPPPEREQPSADRSKARASTRSKPVATETDPASVIAELRRLGRPSVRDGMARFAIPSHKAFGIPVGELRALGKRLGPSHELAGALWQSGWYEARLLACFVDDAARVTAEQMDQWCRDFDSWAVCDTACFHLFDRTPHAFAKVTRWSKRRGEFERRAAFALLASVALHDRDSPDAMFSNYFPLIEQAATDARNFVKKAVSWALRGIGGRNLALHAEALAFAQQLAASEHASVRWVGKDAVRDLSRPALVQRLAKRKRPKGAR